MEVLQRGGRRLESTQDHGYVYFEDGVNVADLEIDFAQFSMMHDMTFRIEIIDVRGCVISEEFYSTCVFIVRRAGTIPKGMGYIEFIKQSHTVDQIKLTHESDYDAGEATEEPREPRFSRETCQVSSQIKISEILWPSRKNLEKFYEFTTSISV